MNKGVYPAQGVSEYNIKDSTTVINPTHTIQRCVDCGKLSMECGMMHDVMQKKSIMMESRKNMPFGKDYGFTCTCITGSTKFPKSLTTSKFHLGYGTTPVPISFVRKSRLNVVSMNSGIEIRLKTKRLQVELQVVARELQVVSRHNEQPYSP
ncbi:hypothetical protein MTR_0393s0020 [Medicago truncatula]|uniref:Uncharacterized protein n=1 Tax=Medicago truncatula TaxID=3880 RepID=A0A072TG77_MEDTR|nr:hypothetical protein MTR_0393s0020 [Medicago truncatula]